MANYAINYDDFISQLKEQQVAKSFVERKNEEYRSRINKLKNEIKKSIMIDAQLVAFHSKQNELIAQTEELISQIKDFLSREDDIFIKNEDHFSKKQDIILKNLYLHLKLYKEYKKMKKSLEVMQT
jgi:hypothetical protein